MEYHFFADDTSLYITFETSELANAITQMQCCAEDVRRWMCEKKKTENEQ
jgi:hypothetical protein